MAITVKERAGTDRSGKSRERQWLRGYAIFQWAKRDPDLEPLRGHPRFVALLEGK